MSEDAAVWFAGTFFAIRDGKVEANPVSGSPRETFTPGKFRERLALLALLARLPGQAAAGPAWQTRMVRICPRCVRALNRGTRASLAPAILAAGTCGHPEPRDDGTGVTIAAAWPPGSVTVETRTRNALLADGFATLSDVAGCTEGDLMDVPTFGAGCLAEVRRVLPLYGLALKGEERAERAAS
jgi:hypothetical protein